MTTLASSPVKDGAANSHSPPRQAVYERVQLAIQDAAHRLPSQGPISVFVHHNTLHAFEDLPFEQAVLAGGKLYHCEPYLTEERYRSEFQRGRIRLEDLRATLLEDLADEAEILIATLGTRYALRLAMLQFPARTAPGAELQWLIAETQALERFRDEVEPASRRTVIATTQSWARRVLEGHEPGTGRHEVELLQGLLPATDRRRMPFWSEKDWESFALRFLWRVCSDGAKAAAREEPAGRPTSTSYPRLRDLCLQTTGQDSDRLVDEVLIRFCAAFLDQGFAAWQLPDRELGFWKAFARLYSCSLTLVPHWMRGLRDELREILECGTTPLESIASSLEQFAVPPADQNEFISSALLALRGWTGLMWQMEGSAPWSPHPAPPGTLESYLAVRLLLEQYALAAIARQELSTRGRALRGDRSAGVASARGRAPSRTDDAPGRKQLLEQLREELAHRPTGPSSDARAHSAFTLFQLAQVRGWHPCELVHLSPAQWRQLYQEVKTFSGVERRRIFHLAYERRYRNAALDALVQHGRRQKVQASGSTQPPAEEKSTASYQVVCCIDDREESFRRHLEECDPSCETFGAPGYYGVAMYYQGATDAHSRPLCPITVTPRHYVREEPAFSTTSLSKTRTQRRRIMGRMTHQVHTGSRTLLGGVVTGVLGSFATIPLIARVLAPRLTSQLRSSFGHWVRPPATELHLERVSHCPGPEADDLGYSIAEMAAIVARVLQDIGLVESFAPILLFVGHGSSSLNNPHESAYNCGACSGGRGGPNARSIALMANDRRVRALVAQAGIRIPEEVHVLGAYHNTCNDQVEYYELDQLPRSHRRLFRRMEQSIDEARARNAQERSRRFESATSSATTAEALEHVEERSEDLSQTRPEYNHASNALCFVGRRNWSRGLFLDRRAFLTSYDPTTDDDEASILARILGAAIPVCAGISLEYFFSTVDNEGYGCGSKLPHNIASLVGVMTGAASDLRPGLSAQMVEIHEPMRMLFVIETTPEKMLHIIDRHASIGQLVRNQWVQLAVFDPAHSRVHRFNHGRFEPYAPQSAHLPTAHSSLDWHRGQREHLAFATIINQQTHAPVEPVHAPPPALPEDSHDLC